MECAKCNASLLKISDLFFFCKSEKDVHLTIKPEILELILNEKTTLYTNETSSKRVEVKCVGCHEHLGSVWPYGPNGEKFYAFGCESIRLNGKSFTKKNKWWKMYSNFSEIDTRDVSTFNYTFNVKEVKVKKKVKVVEASMRYPQELKDFEWYTVSREKTPKPFQIEAYVQALQKNLIAVIKTGSGKTLIASMLLAKMRSLNPDKMGLFIVDRVPLAFQQGEALRRDTGLVVISISGENKTTRQIQLLNENRYDILVITAGAFYDLVSVKKKVDVNQFCAVVLDECHHVRNGHVYVKVLKLFTSIQEQLRPRILGLTASPVKVKTYADAVIALAAFVKNFPSDTKIYYPKLEDSVQKIEEETIQQTEAQQDFVNKCIEMFKRVCTEISKTTGDITTDLVKAVGELRAIANRNSSDNQELHSQIKDALRLLDAVEMCNLMGIPYGRKQLIEGEQPGSEFQQLAAQFHDNEELSPRLVKLQETISTLKPDSRAIVFVSRRDIARKLDIHLKEQFKELNVEKIVGHGGYDGMVWGGEEEEDEQKSGQKFGQKDIIKRFKKGHCKLLVSTSVLEEGIDVDLCDLVVYFTGVTNLIKFIQARGRARKEDSRFIVYQSEGESSKKRDLQNEEKMLQAALKRVRNVQYKLDDESGEIIRKIEENMEDDITLPKRERKLFPKGDSDFSFMVYVDPLPGVKVSDIKEKLMDLLQEIQEFKLNRLDRITDTDTDIHVMARNAVTKYTLRFLVGVKCENCDNPMERYERFCQIFSYSIDVKGMECQMWTKLKNEHIIVPDKHEAQHEIQSKGFQLGYFRNKISYVVGHTFNYEATVSMTGTDIVMIYKNKTENNREEQIIIPKTSIGNFVLLSNTGGDTFKVAFYIAHCPTIEKKTNERLTILETRNIGEALAKYPLLLMNFENEKLNDILTILNTAMPVPYFNVNLKEAEQENVNLELSSFEGMDGILWSLKYLEDSRTIMYLPETPSIVFKKIAEQPDKKDLIEKVVYYCCLHSNNNYFCSFENLLSQEYNAVENMPEDEPVPNEYHLIKRVVVTPLRIMALPAVPIASNRIVRKSIDRFEIIVVSFKDEDGCKLRTQDAHSRVKKCIEDGISINGRQFKFLLPTSSQLRDHKAYFLAATVEEIDDVRKEIIPKPEHFDSHAKYIARLGMYGTADKCVGKIEERDINQIKDLSAHNKDEVTDGAGKIAESVAKEITAKLDLKQKEMPSAFQIRFSGIKGILVTTPDNDPDLDGKKIAVRYSMDKFKNDDKDFCVTSTSKINEFTLNREIITLLDAIPEMKKRGLHKTLMDYQENALAKYSEMFTNILKAEQELRNYLPPDYVNNLSSCGMELLEEKYWISILQGIYRLRTSEIRTKTSIPVDKSCLLVGVPDPFGVLKEDEVFVQLRTPENTKIIEGSVLIFRNPCLHPGDIRTVKGVYIEELKHLYNVVVFPTNDCKQSLAVSCSGGDLDGDQYAVIWDENLIPPKECMYEPCDYTGLEDEEDEEDASKEATTPIITPTPDVTDKIGLAEYFVKFMSNDCLGRVAHKHLALCDILDEGARDPVACELAKVQAQAVDFPKTGKVPMVRKETMDLVKTFPDFMEKAVAETHYSEKVLGDMYRQCRSVIYDFDGDRLHGMPDVLINRALIIEGNQKYLKYAERDYLKYAKDMQMVMKKFELKIEADIVLGQATKNWSMHLEADKGKSAKAIQACYEAIVKKYRSIFSSDVKDEQSRLEKASAWYRIVNDTSIETQQIRKDGVVFRSFPWVVSDKLCVLRERNSSEQKCRMKINLGESALAHFKKHSLQLINNIAEKMSKLKDVERAIDRFSKETFGLSSGFLVSAYGSTSIYVCEQDSDIDICVLPKPTVFESNIFQEENRELYKKLKPEGLQRYLLRNVISKAVDKISTTKRDVLDAKVPIIKCSFADGDQQIQCDISMNKVGFRKTLYIHYLYETQPWYLPLFWILVRWARLSGIIKSEGNTEKRIDTAEFYALIIHVLELPRMDKMELTEPSSNTSIEVLNRRCDLFKLEHYHELGLKIFDFFRKASTLQGNIQIKWPAPGIEQVVDIDDSVVKFISTQAKKAFHAVSATRDVNTMLEYFLLTSSDKTEYIKKLPLNLSYAIGKARSFHAARLSEVTGADLVDISIKEGTCNLVLTGRGSRLAIENLKNEIRSLVDSNKALVQGRLPQKGSRYFMEGSSIIMARNNNDVAANLHFNNSFSSYELHHESCQRSATFLKNHHNKEDDENYLGKDSWKEKEITRLCNHISDQLKKFPTSDNEDIIDSLEITCRLGTFYLVDINCSLPDSQTSIQIRELQAAVEKGRRSRKAWQRSDFRVNYDDHFGDLNDILNEQVSSFEKENNKEKKG